MNVKELKPKQGNVDIIVDVVDVGPIREFQKFGKPGKVATAIAKDETGDVKLTLWNDDIAKVTAGDKIHLTNGYVNEWQGEIQLTTGKLGKLEVVGKSDSKPAEKEDETIHTNFSSKGESIDEDFSVEEENIEDDEI